VVDLPVGCPGTSEDPVPLITSFNLHREDRLGHIETALREALVSLLELQLNAHVVDFVPVLKPDALHGTITRINIDLWEHRERTKEGLQELAARVAKAFRSGAGTDKQVKVVIRPYDVGKSGWVSF
jgi:hypothetical protein